MRWGKFNPRTAPKTGEFLLKVLNARFAKYQLWRGFEIKVYAVEESLFTMCKLKYGLKWSQFRIPLPSVAGLEELKYESDDNEI